MRRGFTAIESFVVILIVATLAAIIFPAVADAKRIPAQRKARLEQGLIEIRKIIDHPTDSVEIDNERLRDALRRVQGGA